MNANLKTSYYNYNKSYLFKNSHGFNCIVYIQYRHNVRAQSNSKSRNNPSAIFIIADRVGFKLLIFI